MTYREGAERFYDLFGTKDDLDFYRSFAEGEDRTALELGVGTGRLAIQLARSDVEVWGIDNSQYMLNAALRNIGDEPDKVKARIHLELADVRDFNLERAFDLIYFPSYSFDHLLNREDQLKCLRKIHNHLKEDGIYAFDLANVPEVKADSKWFMQRKKLGVREVIRTGFTKTHPEARLLSIYLWYEVYEGEELLECYFEGGDVYIHSLDGIRKLLDEAGFQIKELFGGYDRSVYTGESEMMVIVASLKPDGLLLG